MAKTKTELATRTLAVLGLLQAGQTPNSEDLTAVEDLIDPLVALLGLTDVIYIGDTEDIDDAAFLPLAARLALEAAPDFGLPAVDDDTKLRADIPLRRLAGANTPVPPMKAQYF